MISNEADDDWADDLFFQAGTHDSGVSAPSSLAPVAMAAEEAPSVADFAWAERRARLTRLVTRTVVGLGAFAILAPLAQTARTRAGAAGSGEVVASVAALVPPEEIASPASAPAPPVASAPAIATASAVRVESAAPPALPHPVPVGKARVPAAQKALAAKAALPRTASDAALIPKPAAARQPSIGRFADPS